MSPEEYAATYLREVSAIAEKLDVVAVGRFIEEVVSIREQGGRLFFLGVGGSAANASHAVNDFRKIAGIECYAVTDNVSELTARINDDGWDGCYTAWLRGSRLGKKDGIVVLSVGGGDEQARVSLNLIDAIRYAKDAGAKVLAIVGRDSGYAARHADVCVLVPRVHAERVTPHAEEFQSVLLHLVVSHPAVARERTKWETVEAEHRAVAT